VKFSPPNWGGLRVPEGIAWNAPKRRAGFQRMFRLTVLATSGLKFELSRTVTGMIRFFVRACTAAKTPRHDGR